MKLNFRPKTQQEEILINDTFWQFQKGEIQNDSGQNYMNLNVSKILQFPEKGIKKLNYIIEADDNPNFISDLIIKIKKITNNSQPFLLGPLYFKLDSMTPYIFQTSVTGTGKNGEDFDQIMKRELLEELGLEIISNGDFISIYHVCTRRTKKQLCTTYLIEAKSLSLASIENASSCKEFLSAENDIIIEDGINTEKKIQIFIYGEPDKLEELLSKQIMKPFNYNNDGLIEFYDKEIMGLAMFSIRRLNKFRKNY